MQRRRNATLVLFFSLALITSALTVAAQPDDDRDRVNELSEITVTGMQVTAGGAKDINFFRGEVDRARIPMPDDITAEGLLSEHDIELPSSVACRQLFCLTAEAAPADLLARPDAKYLVGLGFTSNIDAKSWHRQPLNLVAVVDKSGSMDGHPLEMVRLSLGEVLKQLGPGDQFSIVLYGDRAHVHLAPTPVTGQTRDRIQHAIDSIRSQGSTSMEAGLTLGYQVANESAPAFHGTTRLMLFTDERPNVDATDAGSFMTMAIDASRHNVGLTTIGVGIQFGADLATRISSVRGGNLFFIRDREDVLALYAGQLDYMVSELAHDLRVVIKPHAGYKISGVYGVPGQLLGWQPGDSVAVTVPTVFLSDKGGGIFFTLTKAPDATFLPATQVGAGDSLAAADVTYLPVGATQTGQHSISVAPPGSRMSAGMRTGRMLVDEFLAIHTAVTAHYRENDQEKAFQLMHAMANRLEGVDDPGFKGERELVNALDDQLTFLSGHSSEGGSKRSRLASLWGKWEVTRAEGDGTYARLDVLEFSPDDSFHASYYRPRDGAKEETGEYQSNDRQVLLTESELVFNYRVSKDLLVLTRVRGSDEIFLRKLR